MKPQSLALVPREEQLIPLWVTQILLVSVLQTLRSCCPHKASVSETECHFSFMVSHSPRGVLAGAG